MVPEEISGQAFLALNETPWAFLSSILNPWTLAFLVVLFAAAVASAAFIAALIWAAKGSPDVNGDPERDSGLSDLEIERNAAIAARRAEIDRKYRVTALRRPIVHRPSSIVHSVDRERGFWLKGTSHTTNQSQPQSYS